jgi:hypothetical protein
MPSLRTWRAVAAGLLLVVLAATATTAAAGSTTPSHQARYCKRVDAYRIKTCAKAILPATPVGRQLRWALAQLGGDAATLTEAEVRAHFSAEFLTIVTSPAELIDAFRQTIADHGPLTFIGFSYPPRAREALALAQTAMGDRAVVAIGVARGRPALIEAFNVQQAPPTIVPKGRYSGWFDIGGRRLFRAAPAIAAPPWCSREG